MEKKLSLVILLVFSILANFTIAENYKIAFGSCLDQENPQPIWNSIYKDEIYQLTYENLISNKENEVKKLLKFCDLDWDENCLNPQNNKKAVATASLAQVRTPIYKTSIAKWKNLEEELIELKEIIKKN